MLLHQCMHTVYTDRTEYRQHIIPGHAQRVHMIGYHGFLCGSEKKKTTMTWQKAHYAYANANANARQTAQTKRQFYPPNVAVPYRGPQKARLYHTVLCLLWSVCVLFGDLTHNTVLQSDERRGKGKREKKYPPVKLCFFYRLVFPINSQYAYRRHHG